MFTVFVVVLVLIDLIWIKGAFDLHQRQIRKVQKSELQFSLLPAILFYILAGMMYVLIIRKLASDDITLNAFYGAIVGAGMYFTFDLTNKAIFKDYEWSYAIKDGLWGTFAIAAVSAITAYFCKNSKRLEI
jgi:uncharacterized membrane protein